MRPAFTSRTRRPSRITHRAKLEAEYRKKTPAIPPDGDTFFYNEAFLCEWEMAPSLWIRLPAQLTSELRSWQAAGAAVMTVLARYDNLEREAPTRGWPERTNIHLSRTTSQASHSLASPNMPAVSSPSIHDAKARLSLQTNFQLDVSKDKDGVTAVDLDTPPFTPHDNGLGDNERYEEATTGPIINNETDLEQVNSRLTAMALVSANKISEPSPMATPSSRRASGGSQASTNGTFDEAAWDVYLKACKAELDHLHGETLVRFRHLGRGIDRLWTELKLDSSQHILENASVEFVAWWKQMSEKAQDCENEVRALALPDLEEVKVERLAQGLPV